MDLNNAVVVITGGVGGIGSALGEAFAGAGAVSVAADLPGRGAEIDLDVTDVNATRRALSELRAKRGRLDVVIANAGVGVGGLVEDVSAADWDRCIDVNVRGTANTVQAAYPLLVEARGGALVLMASLSGLLGTPLLTPYAMTKHAVVGLGASLRPEAARHGVGVTVVCPGPVDTPLLDESGVTRGMSARRYLTAAAGKPLTPAQLAEAVVNGVRHDRGLVTPGRAALLWRLNRMAPNAVGKVIGRNLRDEVAAATRS